MGFCLGQGRNGIVLVPLGVMVTLGRWIPGWAWDCCVSSGQNGSRWLLVGWGGEFGMEGGGQRGLLCRGFPAVSITK